MIIVEGSDHVGKTTFCKKLVKEMGGLAFYRHMSKPTDDFDYFGDYLSQLRSGDVYDRFHYGAYVYGAMLNLHPTKGFSLDSMRLVSRFIHLRRGLIIVIHDSNHPEYERRLIVEGKEEMFMGRDMRFANMIFSKMHLVDENPTRVIDIKGGNQWPTEEDAGSIVTEWRLLNGLQ